MLLILAIVLPVFGLIGLGLVAVKLRLLTAEAAAGVGQYAFVLAMPSLLFRTLAGSTLPAAIPWGYWASYFGAIALAWGIAQASSRILFSFERGEAVLAGMAAAMGNTVMIGIPLLVKAYGEEVGVPVALILGLNLPLTMVVATLMVESASGRGDHRIARRLLRGLATHPLFIAIVSGVVFNLAGLKLPDGVDRFLGTLSATAVPCALISLGGSLAQYGVMGRVVPGLYLSVVKLIVTPGLVYGLGKMVFALPPIYLATAVVFAAAPVGVNVYLFALRHQTGLATTSATIALSSLLAVFSTSAWLWFLGIGG